VVALVTGVSACARRMISRGVGATSWAGLVYLLVFPLQTINSRVMGSLRRRYREARTRAGAGGEGP
jgi:hypothetical protein